MSAVLPDPQDRAAVLAAVEGDGLLLRYASEDLRGDVEVVQVALAQTGVALQYATDDLRDNRELVQVAVRQTWVALEFASDSLKNDLEIVQQAVGESGLALKDASPELCGHSELVLKAVEQDGLALHYASDDLRSDEDIVEAALLQNPASLEFACEALRADLAIVLPALREDGSILRFASEKARSDRDVVLEACAIYGMALAWSSERCKADREVVTTAVKHCGTALAYASEDLKGNDQIVREACRQDPSALEYASWELRCTDKELVLDIVERDGRTLKWAADLRNDFEIVKAAVKDCGLALAEASVDLRNDKKIVMAAVAQDGQALLLASPALRNDHEIVITAVASKGLALAHALETQIHDPEIVQAALLQDGLALAYVPEELRRIREIVIAAVSQCGLALQYAPYALRGDTEVALAAINQGGEEVVNFLSLDLKRDPVFVAFALEQAPSLPGILEGKPKPLIRKFALAKVRRWLEPELRELELNWLEMLPVFRLIEPISEFESVFADPAEFIEGLPARAPEVAKAWAVTRVRPLLEPFLGEHGVLWEDMPKVLKLTSNTDLATALAEPKQFMQELSEKRVGEATKWFLIARIRAGLEPMLPQGLPWQDVAPVLDEVETTKELKDFIGEFDLLMWKLINGGDWPAALAYARVALRPTVEPLVPGDPKPMWADFFLILQELDDAELREAIQDVMALRRYLLRLRMDPHLRTAKLWAIAQLRPTVEPQLDAQGMTWEDALAVLEGMDTMRDLQPGVEDPAPILTKLAFGMV